MHVAIISKEFNILPTTRKIIITDKIFPMKYIQSKMLELPHNQFCWKMFEFLTEFTNGQVFHQKLLIVDIFSPIELNPS